jgi:hypothetical protein
VVHRAHDAGAIVPLIIQKVPFVFRRQLQVVA